MRKRTVKLNLGCGPTGINGWVNYDWGWLPLLSRMRWVRKIAIKLKLLSKSYDVNWPKIELVDIRKRLPMETESVDYIYCSHVLEHLEKFETRRVLKECFRVVKRGGIMRVVLPDLKKIINQYENADQFCRLFYGYDKDNPGWWRIFVRGHEWMYDEDTWRLLLKETGWEEIRKKSWKKGLVPDLDKLDLELHKQLSFYYECKKN